VALNGVLCADVPLRNYSLTHYRDSKSFRQVSADFFADNLSEIWSQTWWNLKRHILH